MPVYNVERYLERAIQCALNQTKQDCELILVNDGSTDGSVEICNKYARKEPLLVQVVHQENRGSGAARNTGLEKAMGKYIYFADPDDYFKLTLIQHNIKKAEDTNADVVVFGYTEESEEFPDDREEKLPNIPNLTTKEHFRNHFRNFYHFSPYALWNKLYRKEFLVANAIQFTDQKLGQDALFNLDVFFDLEKVAVNRKAYYHYVNHDGSAVNRYRSDRFILEYNIACRFERLIQSWDMETEFADLIAEEFWHPVYLELANVTHPDCPMTTKEKIEWIETILKDEKIKYYTEKISRRKEKNPFKRRLMYNIKNEQVSQALQLMSTRNKVEKRFTKLFNRTKFLFLSNK